MTDTDLRIDPLTGRRVADLPLTDGRRLYQALRSGRFLLAGGPGTLPAGSLPAGPLLAGYADRVETAEVARPTGIVALIRPDAYIAWAHGPASQGDRTTEIHDALTRWCGTRSTLERDRG